MLMVAIFFIMSRTISKVEFFSMAGTVAIVMPADGPSFGIAPAGTCT